MTRTSLSVGVRIVGIFQLLICSLIGIPLLLLSLWMFYQDAAAMAGGDNLNGWIGLGTQIGLRLIVCALFFLFGLISAIYLLRSHPKGKKLSIGFLVVSPVFLYFVGAILTMDNTFHWVRAACLPELIGIICIGSLIYLIRIPNNQL
jgi:hypothetical protein